MSTPEDGVYWNVPATGEVASSCVALSAVPKVIAAGVAHTIEGVALLTSTFTVTITVE